MSDVGTNYHKFLFTRGPLRIIAVITLWSFLITTGGGDILVDKTWAASTPLERPNVRSIDTDSPGLNNNPDVETFILPQYLGQVKDRHAGASEKIIIHIQDAHCNYAAQHQIKDIIAYFRKEYGISMVNLEGGAQNYDLSIFTNIREKEVRQKVTDHFVREGLVSGAELFAINDPEKVTLWGVEDVDLYLKNLNVYRNSLAHKEEVDKHFKQLGHILENLKRHIYPGELLEIDAEYVGYKSGKVEFKQYLVYLYQKAQEKSIDIAEYPNIAKLKSSLEIEKEIDFKQANNERNALIDRLRILLSKTEVEKIVLKTIEFKRNIISQDDYYNYLLKKAKFVNLNMKDFPELSKYTEYTALYNSTDKTALMQEMPALEEKIKESLFTNPEQRRLDFLSKNFELLKSMFNFSLTREDYRYYMENEDSFSMTSYTPFVDEEAPKYKITAKLGENITDIDLFREEIIKFYEYGFERDKAFMENIRFSKNQQATILVTGGFHSDNLYELLKKNDISYISIMPRFKCPEGYESPYFNLLAGNRTGLEQQIYPIFEAEYSIQIAAMLSNALASEVWGKANIDSFRAAILIQTQIAKGRDISRITRDGDNIVFHMADGTTETMPVRGLLDAVHQQDIDGQMEKLSENDFEDIENIDSILGEIIEFLRSIGATQEVLDRVAALKGTNADGRALVRLVNGVSFRGHAGGQGIRLNAQLKGNQDSLKAVLLHEIIAGLFGDHFLAERVEQAYQTNQSGEIMLADAPALRTGIWDMTPGERLGVDRDFAADAQELAEALPTDEVRYAKYLADLKYGKMEEEAYAFFEAYPNKEELIPYFILLLHIDAYMGRRNDSLKYFPCPDQN